MNFSSNRVFPPVALEKCVTTKSREKSKGNVQRLRSNKYTGEDGS